MNRRGFLQASGLAIGGLVLAAQTIAGKVVFAKAANGMPIALGDFIRITPDGEVLFWCLKHEMGQGIATAMAQILCEELDAAWEKIRVEFPTVDLPRYDNDKNGGYGTGGSCSLIYTYDVLRYAGATARQMLIAAAAQQWGVPVHECTARQHSVLHEASSRSAGFGELAPAAAQIDVPDEVRLKEEKTFKLIGAPKPAKLNRDVITGALRYGLDVKLPGLLYALVARSPVFKGKLKRYDASRSLRIPGVRKVFTTQPIAGPQPVAHLPHDIREGVVVVADSFWAALKGRQALEIEWDEGENAKLSSADFERLAAMRAMQRSDPTGFIGDENAVADLSRVRKTLRAAYVFPHQLHSCMEPLNCTAHVREDACDVWLGTQDATLVVSELQRLLDLPQERIHLHLLPSGGGFGRRAYTDLAVEAAFISREAGHVPVKMVWTREDDQQCNLVHLFQHMEYQAALDAENRLFALYEKEIRTYTWAAKYADPALPRMAYDIPNLRHDFEDLGEFELAQSSACRGVDMHGKALAECFIDEIAAELEQDPVEFRLSMLKPGRTAAVSADYMLSSDRMRAVLLEAATRSGWGAKLPPGRGRGVALIPYGDTCCAAVAEVTVQKGALRVDRLTVAIDCGRVVNPSGAEQQIVGGLIWSLTALLYGGAPIENGRLVYSNFHENRLLRMNECPHIDLHFVNAEHGRPGGLGEVSSPLAVPAVLNAIYAATGQRLRKVPIDVAALMPKQA